jgi:hypothetical protein
MIVDASKLVEYCVSPQPVGRTGPPGHRASPSPVEGRSPGYDQGPMTAGRARGQTTFDFAIGVSIFLLALTAVILFIPGTLGPFTQGGQEDIGAANRMAASLSGGLLGDPARPYTLNETCTDRFFRNATSGSCRFQGATLNERVGADAHQKVNVTIRSNLSSDADGSDILCWDGNANDLVEIDDNCDSAYTELKIGNTPPTSSGTSVTARRIVQMEGTQVSLVVEVW